MAVAPKWLNADQIEGRIEVLRTVRELLDKVGNSRGSVEQRFDYATAVVARSAVREADHELHHAHMAALTNGAAPVEEKTLNLVRTFNSIGPARLVQLLGDVRTIPIVARRGVDDVPPPSSFSADTQKPE